MDVVRIRRSLLRWFARSKRTLPWRQTRDAYAIWVSEMMLQQTTVTAVIPYYERFMKRFPTVHSLAASAEDEVLALWSGLGYYSRARNLRAGAQTVVERHQGSFPKDLESAMDLKGVGRYTAGAVTSMAYGTPAAVVDGNVRRVVSRLFAEKVTTAARTQELADRLLARRAAGVWNEAMMELGATICLPRNPRCAQCPVAEDCEGRNRAEHWSEGKPRRASVRTSVVLALIESRGRILLQKNEGGRLMTGLLDLPNTGIPGTDKSPAPLGRRFPGLAIDPAATLTVPHTVTHHRITARVHRGSYAGRSAGLLAFHPLASVADLPLGGLTRKILRRLGRIAG